MSFVQTNYNNALRFNSILWNAYIAEIIDINKVPDFTSMLQYALNQANIILTPEEQVYLDSILDLNFFQLNFADAMIYCYRILKLIPPSVILPDHLTHVPTLAEVGAIQYKSPFSDNTYSYLDVLTIPENNIVNILVDWLVQKSATDPIISQEDRDFINSILNN